MPRLLALAVLACALVPIGRAAVAHAQFPGPQMGGPPPGGPGDQNAADVPDEPDEDVTADDEAPSDEGPDVNVPTTICQDHQIRHIQVIGADHVGADEVLHNMHLHLRSPCTDAEVTADAHTLWDLGYFDDLRFEASLIDDDVDLRVTVHERPRISAVTFHGNHAIESNDLKEKVTLRDGSILALADVRESVTKLRDLYAEKGYFLARIHFRLIPHEDNQVELRFDITEGEQVTVRRIRFVGNRALTDDEIAGVMQTHATGFFSFISNDNTFKRENLDEDAGRLQALYYDRGYLTMRAGAARIDLTPDRRHVDITIPVDEGPRIHVGRLRIAEVDENGDETEHTLFTRRELREHVHMQPGDWFSRTAIAHDLLDVTRLYRDRGYARVTIAPHTDVDLDRRTVSVLVTIERGSLVHIERIEVRGNAKTRDLVIRRELVISEGDLYSQTLIERSKARVQQLGYFEHVDESEEEGSSPDRMVLNFEVAEKSTGTFQVGAGFSSIESFIFTAQVQQQNLFGFGQSLSLQLQLSGIRQLAQIRLVEPYLFGTDWTGAIEAYRRLLLFTGFQRESYGGSLTLGHTVLTNELRLFLQYTGEYVNVTQTTGGLLTTAYGNQNIAVGLRLPLANLFRSGFTSSLRLSLTYDTRDNRLFPTKGIYVSISSEVADPYLGSQNTFVRNSAFFRWYYPLFGGVVLKMNTEAGIITSRDPAGVPIYERYFLGGILNLRGFFFRSIGPRLGIPTVVDPNPGGRPEGEPIGGNIQFYYNLEIEFPIIESVGLKGVIFTDGGNAWNLERNICQGPRADTYFSSSDPCLTNPIDLRFSWGFGIRWFSPLGPLRFEWGVPINKLPYENPIDFEFTIGNFF